MPGSIVFGAAGTDKASHAAAADINNLAAFTIIVWTYVTTLGDLAHFASKDNATGAGHLFALHETSGAIRAVVKRATSSAHSESSNTPVATNAWRCVATTWDGTNAPKLFHGTLSAAMAECSYVAGATAGSGAQGDDSSFPFVWGNNNDSFVLTGRLGMGALFGSALSLANQQSWQRRPRKTVGTASALRFVRFGKGAANGIDYGASNNPTVTGATQGDGVPLWQGPEHARLSPHILAA